MLDKVTGCGKVKLYNNCEDILRISKVRKKEGYIIWEISIDLTCTHRWIFLVMVQVLHPQRSSFFWGRLPTQICKPKCRSRRTLFAWFENIIKEHVQTGTQANYGWVHLEWGGYRVPHVMELSLILFTIFINHLEDEQNNTLIKSSGGAKQRAIQSPLWGK